MEGLNGSLTPTVQRGILKAMLHGELSGLDPSVFSTEERVQIGNSIQEHIQQHRDPPTVRILLDSVQDSKVRQEIQRVVRLEQKEQKWAVEQGRPYLLSRALEVSLIRAQAAIDQGDLPGVLTEIRKAYTSIEPRKDPAPWRTDSWSRHTEQETQDGSVAAPTGLPTIDKALGAGLHPGELGAILGSTNRGKSHVGVLFGSASLRRGCPVLDISLEGSEAMRLRRYDRCLSGMTSNEIQQDRSLFEAKMESAVPKWSYFRHYSFPRRGLTVMGVARLVEQAEEAWGRTGLLILDYASILRAVSERKDSHEAIAEVVQDLSALMQERGWCGWTPFQTNRVGELEQEAKEGVPDVNLGHAGESYKAMQHFDVVIALIQSRRERMKKRIKASLKKAREGENESALCHFDWGLSRMWEIGDGE